MINAGSITDYVIDSGEKASKAASERFNGGRTLAAVDTMSRKKNGVKVDMLFTTRQIELGAVEAGRFCDKLSTKSIIEPGFQMPKNLGRHVGCYGEDRTKPIEDPEKLWLYYCWFVSYT